mmetsp:Transcript_14228/g.32300  ORF Transcript_14228/g.32300 Transcript_14228/m.32300 type:complete len:122 (+) Transcript_14228:662-1027(+)
MGRRVSESELWQRLEAGRTAAPLLLQCLLVAAPAVLLVFGLVQRVFGLVQQEFGLVQREQQCGRPAAAGGLFATAVLAAGIGKQSGKLPDIVDWPALQLPAMSVPGRKRLRTVVVRSGAAA